MKYYIAGKVNGLDNYRSIFWMAENELIAEGHQVMNPAILPEGFPYEAYMPICLAMIDQCEAVYMLNNWTDSKGAKVEKAYAEATGKLIEYQPSKSSGPSYKPGVQTITGPIPAKTYSEDTPILPGRYYAKGEQIPEGQYVTGEKTITVSETALQRSLLNKEADNYFEHIEEYNDYHRDPGKSPSIVKRGGADND